MSANNIIIKSAFAMVATAGLTLTAYAGNGGTRYGGPSVYDYESGGNCNAAACAPAQQHTQAAPSSRYGDDCAPAMANCAPQMQQQGAYQQSMPVSQGVVYVDCAAMGTCAPQATYQQPTQYVQPQTYAQQSYTTQTYGATQADCPADTTMQSDGTCMQSSFSSTPTYSSGTSYSSSNSFTGEMVACPSGTTQQSDGSCLQTSSSFGSSSWSSGSSMSSSSSYGSTMTTSAPANCPAGTTAQSDGTCMQGGSVSSYAGGTATMFSDNAASTTSTYGGYTSDGSYSANSYLPIRK